MASSFIPPQSSSSLPGRLFSELPWECRFVDRFPGDPLLENYTREVPGAAYSLVQPTPVRDPKLIGWSQALADELGILKPSEKDRTSLELLSGNRILPGMKPYAARYGGHQFGSWAGQLGDGRAITLGEAMTQGSKRMEFQLKGAGPTPYSRRADGRAVLRSSMREFLCSEAMHFLGVPTTRALSLVATGESVVRDMFYDGNPKPEPGAVVCRVAPSFLRFGNFQIFADDQKPELLRNLADFLIQDHYPELDPASPDRFAQLLDEVSRRTARMITHWMRVGFVHGVMNTDNMSALGLTIDYGPYGWLEPYDPDWTPNTTDFRTRRYRYGAQPNVALWNLARFAEALLPLIGPEKQGQERAMESLKIYQETFETTYEKTLCQKLGIDSIRSEEEANWVHNLFGLLQSTETDLTIFFRSLSDWQKDRDFIETISPAFYSRDSLTPEIQGAWLNWSRQYSGKLDREGKDSTQRSREMKQINPKYVLRNYLAQNAIQAAEKGDPSIMERLLRVLRTPYDELPGEEDLAEKRPEWARSAPGCSALSCSS